MTVDNSYIVACCTELYKHEPALFKSTLQYYGQQDLVKNFLSIILPDAMLQSITILHDQSATMDVNTAADYLSSTFSQLTASSTQYDRLELSTHFNYLYRNAPKHLSSMLSYYGRQKRVRNALIQSLPASMLNNILVLLLPSDSGQIEKLNATL